MKKMKKLIAVIAVAVVAGIAAIFALRGNNGEAKFRTEQVARGDIASSVSASGTVNPVVTVLVGTQVSGTIRRIYADFNSHVKRGQTVAEIDPSTFEAQVEQASANLQAARANVEKASAALGDASRTLQRNRELLARNLIAKSDVDTAETNHLSAVAGLNASRAQVAQAEAALKNAETNLRYTKIVSPVDGIVVSRNVDVGQTVAASFQTPTLFIIAGDLAKMQINASVDEADIGRVKEGQPVEFRVDAYPEEVFGGKVSQVRKAAFTVQNVVTYDVVIKVSNPGLKLLPGMTADVSIITAVKKDALKVPNAALRFRPAANRKEKPAGTAVWTLEKGKPKRIPVTTGISDETHTEVSGEIEEGLEVIVESLTKAGETSPAGRGPRFF